jgi:hypothetical protein
MSFFFLLLIFTAGVSPQQKTTNVRGIVADSRNGEPLQEVKVTLLERRNHIRTDVQGIFRFNDIRLEYFTLLFERAGYESKQYPVHPDTQSIDLGQILLEPERHVDEVGPFISLTEGELDDAASSTLYGFLNSGRDVFLRRAAFDFSQVFYRLRGYDSRNTEVLLNGLTMNSLFDGRPQWNHWGGLNDVTRNQEISYGLQASDYTPGGLLGNVYIDTRPSGMRPGIRVSGAASNRTYNGRIMATYVSGLADKPFQYAVSASRRWAQEGFIDGTLYDSWSAFASLEYAMGSSSKLAASVFYAFNRRGRSAAITDEVASLFGTSYNPYWGYQEGIRRNSRERRIKEPIVQLRYSFEGERTGYELGMMYQSGSQSGSRLGYYDAPNPDPVYYRYLPGYSVNNPSGANFLSAAMARTALSDEPQLNWNSLYRANSQGRAAYLLYDDVADNNRLQFLARVNTVAGRHLRLDAGFKYRTLRSDNYGRILDLLGAEYHRDIDPFSGTRNDEDGTLDKVKGDKFGYSYETSASLWQSFLQLRYQAKAWELTGTVDISGSHFQRHGKFRNGRYPESSHGPGEAIAITGLNGKAGFHYHRGGRHWFSVYGNHQTRPPLLRYAYINPRENNEMVPSLRNETVHGFEFNYHLRLPQCKARLSTYYSRIMDKTDIHFFYSDSGLGSDFVQEVTTGVDQLHMGMELGVEYEFSSAVKASLVASAGKFLYASDPVVTINFDTAGAEEELISPDGNLTLGPARMKDHKLAAGPQRALALGLDYRDPDYWWLGITANYLSGNYLNPSAIIRTESFSIDPDTGLPLAGATAERLAIARFQKPLESIYLLNLTAGKSWLNNGMYVSFFASISNLFDVKFKTGGYEQSRNGNYAQWARDNLSGTPSFGPKYWYGYGRTFFISTVLSF